MIKVNVAKGYHSIFNTENGFYVRKEDPFKAPSPELLDISITNKCTRSCTFCYMNSSPVGNQFISLSDFHLILKQCKSVYQIALGGGEPTIHPQFEEILRTIKEEYNIVPNYTTNGDNLTPSIVAASKKYCGAVAVSVYEQERVDKATKTLLDAGIKTNWHFVVSKKTIGKAIDILENKKFPQGLNAIIFLLYKPIGRASAEDMLTINDPVDKFFDTLQASGIKGGFDACFMNYIIRYKSDKVQEELIDFCDAARYTAYVNWNLDVKPCSFNTKLYGNLREETLIDIWNKNFQPYRDSMLSNGCKGKCDKFNKCYGGCPLLPVNICEERKSYCA